MGFIRRFRGNEGLIPPAGYRQSAPADSAEAADAPDATEGADSSLAAETAAQVHVDQVVSAGAEADSDADADELPDASWSASRIGLWADDHGVKLPNNGTKADKLAVIADYLAGAEEGA